MHAYPFRCESCGHQFEVFRESISQIDDPADCVMCHSGETYRIHTTRGVPPGGVGIGVKPGVDITLVDVEIRDFDVGIDAYRATIRGLGLSLHDNTIAIDGGEADLDIADSQIE